MLLTPISSSAQTPLISAQDGSVEVAGAQNKRFDLPSSLLEIKEIQKARVPPYVLRIVIIKM